MLFQKNNKIITLYIPLFFHLPRIYTCGILLLVIFPFFFLPLSLFRLMAREQVCSAPPLLSYQTEFLPPPLYKAIPGGGNFQESLQSTLKSNKLHYNKNEESSRKLVFSIFLLGGRIEKVSSTSKYQVRRIRKSVNFMKNKKFIDVF